MARRAAGISRRGRTWAALGARVRIAFENGRMAMSAGSVFSCAERTAGTNRS